MLATWAEHLQKNAGQKGPFQAIYDHFWPFLTVFDHFPFWAPGANFEVLPRAKKSKLGQTKKYTPRTIPNDARNIIELG